MIKIIVVEDQRLVRDAICTLLSLESTFDIIAQAEDGAIALSLIDELQPDIVLTDIEMPNMSGIELIEQLAQNHPTIKTMIMTTFSRSGYIKRAITAGVHAFILKEAPSEYLVTAIKKVANNQKVIEPELAISALDDHDPLSEKERKALKLASDGFKTSEIAEQLFLSEGTVRNYLSEAIAKLNAANRIDAARIARQKGWL